MTSRRQRRRERAGAQSVGAVQKYKPPFPLNLLSSQVAFYVIGLLAIVGSLFFFFGSTFDDNTNQADQDIIDITPEEEVDPNDPDATATAEAEEIRQFESQPIITIDTATDYRAVITTAAGEVTIDLLEADSPVAVNNFVFLAEEGFYDGQEFFRVLPDFVAQAGDPTGIGTGGPGYTLDLTIVATPTAEATEEPSPEETETPDEDETAEATAEPTPEATPTAAPTPDIDLTEGVVAMAFDNRTGGISGSQFFIVLAGELALDADEYLAFGTVIDGLDVLRLLTARDPQTNPNAPNGDEIISIEIIEA